MKTTYIIGHRNPDTDSVTSAIALSYLKNKIGMNAEPYVIGEINKETSFVLKYWKVNRPAFLDDVKVQIKDIKYNRDLMINENASIYDAYTYMVDNNITGLPVVKAKNKFCGYVSLKEIATSLIKGAFDKLNSSYDNIVKTLNGKEVLKFDDVITGTIFAATYSSELFISDVDIDDNTVVIVGDRHHVIEYCITNKAKLIVLVGNQELSHKELTLAKENRVNIIKTPLLSFEVSKKIGLSNYIKTILRAESPTVLNPSDYLTDFYEINNKVKHTNYPIIDNKNTCKGLLRILDINQYEKKDVILVDHNDIKQSVHGLNEANIIEIIDHHALGNLTTTTPVSFRNMSVGSTNTILYFLFKESNVKIPKTIAGIMLSGVLSDTLILKSPTTTEIDITVAKELSLIAGVNYKKYGMEMLKAGSSLEGLSVEEIVFYDYKEFQVGDTGFGIGQILTLNYEQILSRKEEYIDFLNKTRATKGFKLMALFITDIINNGSYVLFSSNAEQIIALAYNLDYIEQGHYLEGVISRKKQIIPNIMDEIENMK